MKTIAKVILSLLPSVLCLATPAFAQQQPKWVWVATKSDGTQVYVDENYFVSSKGITSVRIYQYLAQPESDGTRQKISIFAVSCKRKTGTILLLSKFDQSNKLITAIQNQTPNRFTAIAPNSVGDVAFKYGCYKG